MMQLPLELVRHILGFLSGHPEILRVCALSCSTWLAASREHLYHDVTIESVKQLCALECAATSSPYIRDCLHILRINTGRTNHDQGEYAWDDKWRQDAFKPLATFTSLTKLVLTSCEMTAVQLYHFITVFPSLDDLHIEEFHEVWSQDSMQPDLFHLLPTALCLTRLTLLAENIPYGFGVNFFSWVLRTKTKETLQDLTLAFGRLNIYERCGFLNAICPSLEHLELRFLESLGKISGSYLIGGLNLTGNVRLKTLTLPDPTSCVVLPLLTQLSLPEVQRIKFRLGFESLPNGIGKLNHDKLNQLLSRPDWGNVGEVHMLYPRNFFEKDALMEFEAENASLLNRPVLHVQWDHSPK
ncbi:hypothetical protein QCA50_009813 [Cerrena zonata]|uniref:F-box domain-containing protein n=1 Tax=Cerrena zonata TaxID=2478898 RepID=A0AAW0G0P2_9APHY